jgi:hypothetical protein
VAELYGQGLSRREISERTGALSQFAGVRLIDPGRRRRARRAAAGVPHRLRPAVHRARRPGDGHRRMRAQRPRRRLAFAVRLPPSRPARVRRGGRSFLVPVVLRPDGHLRPGPHAVHARRPRRPLCLRPAQDRQLVAARPRRHDPGAAYRLWRALGRRRVHPVGRGRGPAVDSVRRGPAPDPPHRGDRRLQRDPAARPRGQSRLLQDAAHVLLPHQCRLSGAGRGLALRRADPRRGLGLACGR